jgi:hypothetical protein
MVQAEVSQSARSSIAGGFVLVSVASLMACWRACRSAPLGIGDFRAWLAAHELKARRCKLGDDRTAAFTFAELAKLQGVSEKRARASVHRLVDAGLLEWGEGAIGFPTPGLEEPGLADSIGRGRGSLAIPRRMLRLLAGGARPALIATALGLLLRCLSRRKGGFDGRGRVKASWIARVFGVDLRRVKAARRELIDLGWIDPEPSSQHAENQWGRGFRIDLGWDRVRAGGRCLPPLPPADRPEIATPSVDQEPLPEREENQDPCRGPAGVELERLGEGAKLLPAPTLADVRIEDLRDVGRTLRLFDQAVARQLISANEADRLKFLAVAEHAKAVGTVNPCGLFARLVRRGWWHFATLDDEDTARRRLRDHLHGRSPEREAPAARRSSFVPDQPASPPSSLGSVLGNLMTRFGLAPGTGG